MRVKKRDENLWSYSVLDSVTERSNKVNKVASIQTNQKYKLHSYIDEELIE